MFKPRFVIVIPTHDRIKMLGLCLMAIENQTIRPDQVVLVIRESDLKTKKFLEDKIKEHNHLNYKIIEISKPGYIPPVVAGLSFATGDYVGLIDDDVLLNKNWIENAINIFHDNSPKLGAITGPAICEEQISRNVYPAKLSWFGRFSFVGDVDANSENISSVAEGNVVFRGEAIKELKIQRERYYGRVQHHGLDIGLQMQKKGWSLKYSPQIKVKHLQRENCKTEYELDVLSYVGNLAYVIKKNLSLFFGVCFAFYNFFIGQYYFPGFATCVTKKETRVLMVLKAQRSFFNEFLSKK